MTDERRAWSQGNPDATSPPTWAADEPVHSPGATDGPADPDPGFAGATIAAVGAPNSGYGIGGRDGGVTTRLSRRCLIAAAVLVGVAAICLLPVALRDWGVQSAVLTLVALVAIVGGVIMWRRRALWTAVAAAALPPGLGFAATTGDPLALSPRRNGWPVKRRFGALVLPIRADLGVTPGDGALIVHSRADGAEPAAGDRLRVVPIARRGEPVAAGTDPRAAVRVLLVRDADGTMFVATTRVTDTW